ncbi:hypothetical protein JR316_0010645 [Psilocybe cubensis]|uniref:Uncharacterized protein n=2 Tax=Psilocybe cubensis TaxID=181762 RepID=A0ACB8GMP2_PSICU|nr:hypothetical protein JR316_0010645 [Psilocybe cubensis]KAH9476730.1 hypothetical protein JR316_0010645 [Psilocybe cubensis]
MLARPFVLCLVSSAITCVIAAPTTPTDADPSSSTDSEFPEVIPGPGMPSLESLGLTTADLYRNSTLKALSANHVELLITCEKGGLTVSQSSAQACVNYLTSLGTTDCMVPANGLSRFYSSGNANIWGTNVWGNGQDVHSWCSDVGITAQDIVSGCVITSGQVEGYGPAAQNSNLQVSVEAYDTVC